MRCVYVTFIRNLLQDIPQYLGTQNLSRSSASRSKIPGLHPQQHIINQITSTDIQISSIYRKHYILTHSWYSWLFLLVSGPSRSSSSQKPRDGPSKRSRDILEVVGILGSCYIGGSDERTKMVPR